MPVWLPLSLAALAVLVIYLIRPTAQTLPVASTLLWRRLLAARRRRHDRLRWLLSLLLAMTVAGCLALAAGQAPWLQPGGGDRIALAFDPSPTLRAALPDGSGTRMDLAVAEARRTIAQADAGSRFTLGADPTPLTPAEALLALSGSLPPGSFAPEGAAADLEPALPSADKAYLFTDGVSNWKPITDPATTTRTVSVLSPARNAGIVLFVTRPAPSHEANPEALVEVLATDSTDASDPVPVELMVADSETIRIRRQLELPPGNRFTALIDIAGFAPGPVTARIRAPGDVFPLDDRATLIDARTEGRRTGSARAVRPNSERRLFVLTRSRASFDDSAAARAFEADPSVEVVAVHAETAGAEETDGQPPTARRNGLDSEDGSEDDSAAGGDDGSANRVEAGAAAWTPPAADVAVFHRTVPDPLPDLPSLFLDPPDALAAGALSPAEPASRSQERISRVDAAHPILAGVSLLGLPATIARRELDPRCRALAGAGTLTAIAVCDPTEPAGPTDAVDAAVAAPSPVSSPPRPAMPDLTARSVVIAFDLDVSPLSLRPDLAALLQNATEWLARSPADEYASLANDVTGASGVGGLQDERATGINDSDLDPAAPERLAELAQDSRRPWSWRTLAVAGLLLASIEAVTFFRGLTL